MPKLLDSKKLRLIKLQKKHFPLFYKWWNNRELGELTTEGFRPQRRETIEKTLTGHLKNENGFDFIITYDQKPIGHILIQKKKRHKYFEYYIAIGEKKFWNRGLGTLAMKKSARWFFRNFPREKTIELSVNRANLRACHCYENAGFKKIRLTHDENGTWWTMRLHK